MIKIEIENINFKNSWISPGTTNYCLIINNTRYEYFCHYPTAAEIHKYINQYISNYNY